MGSTRNIVALSLMAILVSGCMKSDEMPRVRAGALDLSSWDFETQGVVTLEGEWEICWGALVAPTSGVCPGGGWAPFPVPRLWSDSGVQAPVRAHGVASYRVRVALPPDHGSLTLRVGSPMTAYRLWIDGEPRGGVGTVGTRREDTVAKLANRQFGLSSGATQLDLFVHVANFHFRGGGLRRTWHLGLDDQVATRNSYELLLYAAFSIMSVVIGLVFLAQFAFRSSEPARGWFGLFAMVVGLRIVPGSASDLYQLLMGQASFGFLLRLEYMNTALLIFTAAGYLRAKIPDVMPLRVTQTLQFAALALLPIHLVAPLDVVLATISIILVLPVLLVALSLLSYGRAYRRGLPDAGSTFAAGLGFSVGIVHDVVRTQTGLGAPIELFPYFVVVWMAGEARSLLRSFARTFAKAEKLSDDLQDSNFDFQETEEAVVRFVPFDLLRTLGKDSIHDVEPGDHASVEMTVLCCDLQGVERGTPAETFALLEALIARIQPLIQTRGGFSSLHLADRIVALFPASAADAVTAAGEIHRAVRDLGGSTALGASEPAVRIAIGIATGPVLLGTVGGSESLSGVVLGDTLRLAGRLSKRAASAGSETLLAGSTRDALGPRADFELRELGPMDSNGGDASRVVEVVGSANAGE